MGAPAHCGHCAAKAVRVDPPPRLQETNPGTPGIDPTGIVNNKTQQLTPTVGGAAAGIKAGRARIGPAGSGEKTHILPGRFGGVSGKTVLHARHQEQKRSRETDAGIARRQPPLIELSAGTSAGQRLRRRKR